MKPIPLVLFLVACGSVERATPDATTDDAGGSLDASAGDAAAARCDVAKPFGAPTLVPKVNTSNDELAFTTTRDELTAFVGHVVQSAASATIVTAGRRTASDDFGTPHDRATGPINKVTGDEYGPSAVADGLLVYFHRQSGANIGIYVANRAIGEEFTAGNAVTVDGKPLLDALSATISADGMTLYWLDIADFKLHSATRGSTPTAFTGSTNASTMGLGGNAVLTPDELTLYYSSENQADILVATRTSRSLPFGVGVPVANINSPQSDYPTQLSHDGCVLYLVSTRPGGLGGPDIWEARRPQ